MLMSLPIEPELSGGGNLHAAPSAPTTASLNTTKVTIPSPSEPLEGFLTTQQSSTNAHAIVFCSGLASSAAAPSALEMEQLLFERALAGSSLRFTFNRHRGDQSDLTGFTLTKAINDVEAAVTFMKQHGASQVSVVASSFGAQAALLAAGRGAPIDRLVFRSGIIDCLGEKLDSIRPMLPKLEQVGRFQEAVAGGKKVWFDLDFVKDLMSWRERLDYSPVKAPVVLVHGTKDESVSFARMVDASRSLPNVRIIPVEGGTHALAEPSAKATMMATLVEALSGPTSFDS